MWIPLISWLILRLHWILGQTLALWIIHDPRYIPELLEGLEQASRAIHRYHEM